MSYHDDASLNFSRVSQEGPAQDIEMHPWIMYMSIDTAIETVLPLEIGKQLMQEAEALGVNPYEYTDTGKKFMENVEDRSPPEPDLEITPQLKTIWNQLSPELRAKINQVFEEDYNRLQDRLYGDRRNAIRNRARTNVLKKAVEEQNPHAVVSSEDAEPWGTDLFIEMASRYARKGLPYPVAAARFAQATGYRLTPGVYEIVADQAGTRELIRMAELPRFRCSGCGMMFSANVDSDANNVTCPGCGSMGVTSLDLMHSQSGPQRNTGISTETSYARENLSDFQDSPSAHGASAEFEIASEVPLGPGDVIRNIFSDNTVKIQSASTSGVRGWSEVTHRSQTVSTDDLWAWEKVGLRIDACEVVD